MNNNAFNRMKLFTVPIWMRLASAIIFILFVIIALALVLGRVQGQQAEENLLGDYIAAEGEERQEHISRFFNQALIGLNSFVINPTFNGQIRGSLALDQGLRVAPPALLNYMDTQLVETGIFEYVAILNPDGLVVISNNVDPTSDEATPYFALGTDISNTFGYQAGVIAWERGETQRLSVQETPQGTQIFVSNVIAVSDELIGYVAGVLNPEIILGELSDPQPFRNTHSYLTTLNGTLITADVYVEQAQLSLNHSPVQLAVGGQSGIRAYTVDGEDYIGHYGPIRGTPFAIITETSLALDFIADGFTRRIIPITIALLVVGLFVMFLINLTITPPLRKLTQKLRAMQTGDYTSSILAVNRSDEIGELAREFHSLREQSRQIQEELQARIAERVRDLQATEEVSYAAASERDLQILMDQVVALIIDKFKNIYHAQIFLVNSDRTYAVLRASTGDAGQQLLSRGHRLGVGSISVIGQVTTTGQSVVARDIASSEVHRRNEFLPDTRSELAIPLIFGDTIIGALDVQSKESDTFTDDQVSVLRILAAQIAVGIENARLYQESTTRLQEINLINRRAVTQAWGEYMSNRRTVRLESQAGMRTDYDLDTLREQAIATGKLVVGEASTYNTVPIAVPISLRGEILGAVEWEIPTDQYDYSKALLAQELVNRLAVSLDNARLFQESQRATNRERLVNEIATRLAAQTDLDQILQTAVREVGQALQVPEVSIQFGQNGHQDEENVTNE